MDIYSYNILSLEFFAKIFIVVGFTFFVFIQFPPYYITLLNTRYMFSCKKNPNFIH